MDRKQFGLIVLISFSVTGAISVSSPFDNEEVSDLNQLDRGLNITNDMLRMEVIDRSNLTVELQGLMIHVQERGDNDVLANLSVGLNENTSKGALLGYVSCTDCSGFMSSKVIYPGEKTYLQYEYNLRNQSEPLWREHAIDYIGLNNVPREDIEEGTVYLPSNYVENESEIRKLDLDLPNHTQIENYSVDTHQSLLSTE